MVLKSLDFPCLVTDLEVFVLGPGGEILKPLLLRQVQLYEVFIGLLFLEDFFLNHGEL